MNATAPNSTTTNYGQAGYGANLVTLRMMCGAVRDRHTVERFRTRLRGIFATANLRPMDTAGEIRAVWDFVLGNVRYMLDPLSAEHITDPLTLDQQVDEGTAAEDCESIALYAATLFAANGMRSAFQIMGRDARDPKNFRHCALIVVDPRTLEPISFDPIGYWEGQERGFSFGLGDTLHKPGEPVEYWDSLECRRVSPSELGRGPSAGLLAGIFGDYPAMPNAYNLNYTGPTVGQVESTQQQSLDKANAGAAGTALNVIERIGLAVGDLFTGGQASKAGAPLLTMQNNAIANAVGSGAPTQQWRPGGPVVASSPLLLYVALALGAFVLLEVV